MHEQFHAELIHRFLNELDSSYRLALGDAKIHVSFASGDEKTVELAEKYPLVLSPAVLVLHIQAEPEAAGRVKFDNFSMCRTNLIGSVFHCKPNDHY